MSNREPAYINGGSLRWALNRIKITPQVLAEKTGQKSEDIEAWIAETSVPTFGNLRKVCKFLRVSIACLYLPPEALGEGKAEIDARRIYESVMLRPETRGIILEYIEKSQHYKRLQKDVATKVTFPVAGLATSNIAPLVRDLMGIPVPRGSYANKSKWFGKIRNALFENGIAVFQFPNVPVREIRAFVIHDEASPAVAVNRNDTYAGRIFSCAHEIVHLVTGIGHALTVDDDLGDDHAITDEEKEVNRITAEVIAPSDLVKTDYERIRNASMPIEAICDAIAKKYLASPASICLSLVRTGLVTMSDYHAVAAYFVTKASEAREKVKSSKKMGFLPPAGDALSQNGANFARSVTQAYAIGKISITDALSALDVKYNTFKKIGVLL